jgi:hypothetical protein
VTPDDLLEQFRIFTNQTLKDMIMPIKTPPGSDSAYRAPRVFKMDLPNVKADRDKAPYIVLQFLNGRDLQETDGKPESTCNIRVVACVYSEDEGEGKLRVLNMLTRLRIALLEGRILARRYKLILPLEYMIYPDNPAPFYFGEMMTAWEIPTIERKV